MHESISTFRYMALDCLILDVFLFGDVLEDNRLYCLSQSVQYFMRFSDLYLQLKPLERYLSMRSFLHCLLYCLGWKIKSLKPQDW